MSFLQLVLVVLCATIALAAIMGVAWCFQQAYDRTGWIDVTWTLGTGGVGLLAALAPLGHLAWPGWRQVAVGMLVAAWSLRLGLHIAARSRLTGDDPRYRQLIVQWGADAKWGMFGFLQSQAAVGVILVAAVALAAHNPDPNLRIQDLLGVAILAGAILGEAIADRQLRRFKSNPANRGTVCDAGLWRWSRHPNYFFEWLAWVAYPVIAVDLAGYNPFGWFAALAPLCMYWVLVHVSGVPPLEEHMLRTRGDAYRAYQRRTRPFLPLPIW